MERFLNHFVQKISINLRFKSDNDNNRIFVKQVSEKIKTRNVKVLLRKRKF